MRFGSIKEWRVLIVVLVASCGVALASMAIVRMRNINRGDTTAVEWALDDLRAVSDSTLVPVCKPDDYRGAIDLYRESVRGNSIPVDSIREFYQLYARLARDGRIDSREIEQLGGWLGFAVSPATGSDERQND
ncbi:MAG: hypothetical protein HZB43_01950 [candidate division Zixibacteria bacterium]|nr:hypothetical protein [candidate division Zixibacteria bacterium]